MKNVSINDIAMLILKIIAAIVVLVIIFNVGLFVLAFAGLWTVVLIDAMDPVDWSAVGLFGAWSAVAMWWLVPVAMVAYVAWPWRPWRANR